MPNVFMTPDAVADAIRTVMLTVPGMGLVYTERKVVRTEDDVQKWLYVKDQDRANGWFVTLAPTGTTTTTRNPGKTIGQVAGPSNDLTALNFQIEGYYSVENDRGSEKSFRNLAFAVMTTINSYGIIQGGIGITHQSQADVTQLLYANFAAMFPMHYTTITIGFIGRCY